MAACTNLLQSVREAVIEGCEGSTGRHTAFQSFNSAGYGYNIVPSFPDDEIFQVECWNI